MHKADRNILYFSLPDHQFPETLILVLVSTKRQKRIKTNLQLNLYGMVSGKNPPGKKPPVRVRARVRVRLGIRLGLESGGLFSGGIFSLNRMEYSCNYLNTNMSPNS